MGHRRSWVSVRYGSITQNKTHSGFAPYLILSLGVLVGVSVAWSEVHRPQSDEEYRELQAKVLRGGATIDEVKKLDLESRYRPMRSVKRFTAPGLSTRGTADAIGLKHDSLAFHLEKRFLDNFSFLQKDFSLEAIDDLDEQKEVGWFTCDINDSWRR